MLLSRLSPIVKPNFFPMIRYNAKIDDELMQLGFENVRLIFKTAQQLFDITYVYAEVPTKGTAALGYDCIHFRIILSRPTKEWPHYVQHINAATGRQKRDYKDDAFRIVADTSSDNPPLLSREQLTNKVRALAIEQRERYGKMYRILMMQKIFKLKENRRKGGGMRNRP